MTRSDLIVELTALAEAAEAWGERDIAMILFSLVLAIGEKTDAELACYVALFQPPRPPVPKVRAA
jgi:hypothetical protein